MLAKLGGRAVVCMRFLVGPILVAIVLLSCFCAWSMWKFGNVTNGIDYLNGAVLLADEPVLKLDDIHAGKAAEMAFVLKNITDKPITIMGGKPECSCMITTGLPMTIDPMSSARLRLRFFTRPCDVNQRIMRRVLLYLDVDGPAIILTFSANVVPAETGK